MRKIWKLSSLIALAFLTLVVVIGREGVRLPRAGASPQTSLILDSIGGDVLARAGTAGQTATALAHPIAAVLPHHIVAEGIIGRLVGTLRDAQPHTIVIVGPDHPNVGSRIFSVSSSNWRSQLGTFHTDAAVVSALKALPTVAVNETLIAHEHSVLTPLPFLARQFPQARFVLVTVRGGDHLVEARQIVAILDRVLGPNDLVVASVDFAHHTNVIGSQQEDDQSVAALMSGVTDALAGLPVDSPTSLMVASAFAADRHASARTVVDRGNSGLVLGHPEETDTTGYVTFVWH